MAAFLDDQGNVQQLPVTVGMYRQAAEAGTSLHHWINQTYPTQNASRDGSTWNQLLASEGIFVKPNREAGIRASTMRDVLEGRPDASGAQAAINVKDAVPTSRILFPAVILGLIEDKLLGNLDINANAFDQMVGVDETITGERYEQPLINYSRPEAARSMGIGQLAAPASMMTITTSEKAYKIPSWSIGLEISDQALAATTLDLVALSIARQAAIERNERAQKYILALLNGDVDNNDGSLASKGLIDNSTTFDAAATGGVLTQKAWMKFLFKNSTKRTLTHLVTDLDTAMKIEGRTGKPTIFGDDSQTNRIDTQFSILNPTWAKNPALFLTDIAEWPANTIMAIDQRFAVRRVRNISASYQAIESYVMRRSTALRIDQGEHVNRLYDDAFAGLFLA